MNGNYVHQSTGIVQSVLHLEAAVTFTQHANCPGYGIYTRQRYVPIWKGEEGGGGEGGWGREGRGTTDMRR